MAARVTVVALEPRFRVSQSQFVKLGEQLLRVTKARGHFSIFLLGDKFLKNFGLRLRQRYAETKNLSSKKPPKSFDVLAFPEASNFPDPENDQVNIGEVYLHLEEIERRGANPLNLLVHGYLHLIGYRHNRKSDRIAMEKMEKKLIRLIRA